MADISVSVDTKPEIDKGGRPCKYETHVLPFLEQIFEWMKQGYTDNSICEQLGIHQYTWIRYRDTYNELNELYARARTERNALVMNKMYEKATGYEHKDLFIAQYQGEIVEKEIMKHYPPDVNAADLYLRNNDPDYKTAKSSENNTITINNYQLPELEAKRAQVLAEIAKMELVEVTEYKEVTGNSNGA